MVVFWLWSQQDLLWDQSVRGVEMNGCASGFSPQLLGRYCCVLVWRGAGFGGKSRHLVLHITSEVDLQVELASWQPEARMGLGEGLD